MAIAYDNSTQGTSASTPLTFAHTVAGSNRLLFVSCTVNTGRTVSGITYNGVAMTSINSKTDGGGLVTYLWYLIAPATGSNNVIVTAAGGATSVVATASSYANCLQSGVPDASVVGSDATTTHFTQALSSVNDGCWHIATMRTGNGFTLTADSGTTIRQQPENTIFGAGALLDSNSAKIPAGSVTLGVTSTSQLFGGAVMASFRPAVTASSAVLDTGVFTLTGNNVILSVGHYLVTAVGAFVLTGIDIVTTLTRSVYTYVSKSGDDSWTNTPKS